MMPHPTRSALLVCVLLLAGAAAPASAQETAPVPASDSRDFVRVENTQFTIGGQPYRFVGTNFWYGAYLGADASYGDRDRLLRELDRLDSLGVRNLRVAAASEESDFRLPLSPPFQYRNGEFNETLFQGLDFLLAEMGKRDMRAVLFLNNYWDWTGGMAQYVAWADSVDVVDPSRNDGTTWDQYLDFASRFYASEAAQARYRRYIETVVGRTNVFTGAPYRDDPTIMAWELANEPRPLKPGDHAANVVAFSAWVDETAAFIDSLDANHLVTTGSEGSKGTLNELAFAEQAHRSDHIDYMTIHMWPKNWGWYHADRPETMAATKENAGQYIADHMDIAARLNKPLVIEEFGFVRDRETFSPDSSTSARDEFYRFVLTLTRDAAQAGRPLAGVNVWGWGGEGRAQQSDYMWAPGDLSYVADPYSEHQGLNSVFDTDASTLDVLSSFARELDRMP